jgi:hypothetical protein
MKKIYSILIFSFVILFLNACKKEEVQDFAFNVSIDNRIHKLTDTVVFNIDGNPDVITVYTGDPGHNFDFRDRTSRNDGVLKFGFQIRCDSLSGFTAIANGNFKILVSNDYTASYSTSPDINLATTQDSTMVNKATWTDISSRFSLPSTGTISTFYTKLVDVSDVIKNASNPIYFAFKCVGKPFGNLGANGITIGSLSLSSNYADGTISNYNVLPGGTVSTTWKILKLANTLNSWATSSTQLKFTSSETTDYSEDWAITTNGFYPSLAIPDVAVPLKNISNKPISSYKYKFPKAGDYKVVFMASNNTTNSIKAKVKEIYVTINP